MSSQADREALAAALALMDSHKQTDRINGSMARKRMIRRLGGEAVRNLASDLKAAANQGRNTFHPKAPT